MKISRVIIVSILLPLGAQCAWAGDRGGDQVIGGVVGGVFGGIIGNEIGGRDGAIVGAGLGALTGVALTQGGNGRERYSEERYYRGHEHRGYYEGRGRYDRNHYGRASYEDHRRDGWHDRREGNRHYDHH